MDDLILRSELGDFDLYGNEDIVHTLSILNLQDITSRTGDYTNEFVLPLTVNNKMLIGYSDFIMSSGPQAYSKISIKIIISGIGWRLGFLEITTTDKNIKAKFYSGNTSFYNKIKLISLPDLPWSDFNHVWNLDNAVANSANTTGFFYPIISYGVSPVGTDTVDVRYVLPSTYCKEALDRMAPFVGYSIEYNTSISDFEVAVMPFSKKNPVLSPEVLLANSSDVFRQSGDYTTDSVTRQFNGGFNQYFFYDSFTTPVSNLSKLKFDNINPPGLSSGFDFSTQKFKSNLSGTYNYSATIEASQSFSMMFNSNISEVSYLNTRIKANALVNGVIQSTTLLTTTAVSGTVGVTNVVSNYGVETINATVIAGSIHLNEGDIFEILLSYEFDARFIPDDQDTTLILVGDFPIYVQGTTNTFTIGLESNLEFGSLISYSSILPNMKCSDFLRDMCVRFGFVLNIDESLKKIYIGKLDSVYNNMNDPYNWSSKLDETDPPEIKFKYDSYAQNNNFLHSDDKTLTTTIEGTNYVLSIENENLNKTKDLYKSPFAASNYVNYNGYTTALIPSYDGTTNTFILDVQPRICFSEMIVNQFKFTDGTTTSGYLTAARVWFIDFDRPDLSMGFGMNLIEKNSKVLIKSLQKLKILKAKFNLNLLDLLNLDYFRPVYVEKFQSYFFISSVNQYNFTNRTTTEVELIKLN